MLHNLLQYARRKGLDAEAGFTPKTVRWLVVFDAQGRFLNVHDLADPNTKGSRGRTFQKAPHLKFSGDTPMRQFLVDTAQYALLYGLDKPSNKLRAKHEYFLDLLNQAGNADRRFLTVAKALADDEIRHEIHKALASQPKPAKPADNVTFAVLQGAEAQILVEDERWRDWWRSYFPTLFKQQDQAPEPTPCLLTGELLEPARTHPKIKGLAGVGGKVETTLVGFNQDAFCSYGLGQSRNAAVGKQPAEQYAAALNELIENHSETVAGAKVVYWYLGKARDKPDVDQVAAHDDLVQILLGGEALAQTHAEQQPEQTPVHSRRADSQALARARDLLRAVRDGNRPDLANLWFNAMTIAGNSARVVVRDWMEGQFERLATNIVRWFEALEITRLSGRGSADLAGLGRLITCTLPERKPTQAYEDWVKPVGFVRESLWRASVGGGFVSESAAKRALLQHRAAVVNGEVGAAVDPQGDKRPLRLATLYARIGLMKAYLNLNQPIEDCVMETILKEDHPSAVYQFGRLVAVLTELQREALRKESGETVKSSVVDRFYVASSVTPRLMLNRLVSLSNHHLRKLEQSESTRAAARAIRNRIADIHGRIDDAKLPATTGLDEQCLFALGYYQQIARMNADRAKAAAAKRLDAEDADELNNTTTL